MEDNINTEIKDQNEEWMNSEKEAEVSDKIEGKVDETDLSKAQEELLEMKDKYLRLYADFDNFRKRTMKESLELRKTASQDAIESLLPVLDDFERAKKAADEGVDEPFSDGVNLVYQKLFNTMATKGLKAMETNGEIFDPERHEAITEIPAGNADMVGKIIDTVEKGYSLNDKIIRYAKVVVGK